MLFVNISQAPFIIGLIIILLGVIIFTIYRQHKLRLFFFSKEQQKVIHKRNFKGIKTTKNICLAIITVLLGVSLLDPRGSSLSSDLQLEGIDVILVYDISRSMDATDVAPSRLSFAKNLGEQLIDSLAGNRMALVAYAAEAIRLLPLTTDSSSVDLFVRELSTDMISSQSTDIGKALDEALKNFTEDTLTHKAIVLFSDGENLDGNVKNAIDTIKQQGISIFIIGVGTEEGGSIPIIDKRTGQETYMKDLLGKNIITKLDPKYLQNLATQSKGEYVYGSRTSMTKIESLISNIEKNPFGNNTISYLEPQFRIFILLALLALILYLFLPDKKWYKQLSLLVVFLFSTVPSYTLTKERQAYSSYQNGEYSTALRFFQRSLVQNPQNIKSKFGEASTLYKLERNDRAEKSFLALTNSTDLQIAQKSTFNAGNTQVQRKEFDEALDLYKKVMADNPIDSRLYKKALNNYIYTRALQQQKQQQQQENDQKNDQDQSGEGQKGKGQDSKEQDGDKGDQQDKAEQGKGDEGKAEEADQQEAGANGTNDQQEGEGQNAPAKSVSPSDIDNLLGIAQKSENDNFSKQHKQKKGLLQQNKY
ncbi:MAG: VWA domain-containing protein [Spirochaetota bacterium]|nr:VWA domain-containing protein [Spirochaetota bacterium]